MGYTHYWYQKADIPQDRWDMITDHVLDVIVKHCDAKKITLAYELNSRNEPQPTLFGGQKYGPTVPEVNKNMIRFNGWREQGCETFIITRKKPHSERDEYFGFCKTARKPYDLAVCLTLIICKHFAPDEFTISTDGTWDEDWLEARKVFKKLFGFDTECPFEKEAA